MSDFYPVTTNSQEPRLGINFFLTRQKALGGRLRRDAEDFVVVEISDLPPESEGELTAALVTSKNWENNRLVRTLARNLRISRRKVMFAGTKDKRAITTQLIVFHAPLVDVQNLRIPDVTVEKAYTTGKKIRIGDLYGNNFEIKITELAMEINDVKAIADDVSRQLNDIGGFANYFGVQRFGAARPVTHIIGRCIIEGRFRKAVETYLWAMPENERNEVRLARNTLKQNRDYSEALRIFPKTMGFEKAILNHLIHEPDDHVGALNNLPKNLLMMFVHAYQSYIFNRTLSARMKAGLPLDVPVEGDVVLKLDKHKLPDHRNWLITENHNIDKLAQLTKAGKAFVSAPLIGHESQFAEGEPGEIEKRIFEDEKVNQKDFIIPAFEKLSSKGTRREILASVGNLKSSIDGGALKLQFELNKGCYATSLLREYMKSENLLAY